MTRSVGQSSAASIRPDAGSLAGKQESASGAESGTTSGWRSSTREIGAFGIVGLIGFGIDLGLFNLLFSHGQVVAKCVSTVTAMAFTFMGNRLVSFSRRRGSALRRELVSFLVVNLIALAGSLILLAVFEYPLHQKGDLVVMNAVNLVTILGGSVFRFWAYRAFVFQASASEVRPPDIAPVEPLAGNGLAAGALAG